MTNAAEPIWISLAMQALAWLTPWPWQQDMLWVCATLAAAILLNYISERHG